MSEKNTPLKVIAGTPDRPLVVNDIEIPCYVLEDETRVLSQRGLQSSIGMGVGGSKTSGARRIGDFLGSLSNKGITINELMARINNPIEFQTPWGGRTAFAYPATLLVDLCDVILDARFKGVLHARQDRIAEQAEILMRGLATIGIIALIDEATGYQEIRAQRALATILERFIDKELQPWTKTFPYEFYEELYRLRRWPGPHGHKRTHQIGRDTNDLVYERLAPGVLNELRKKNPTLSSGRRKNRHHQWFTPDFGHPKLKEHLAGVMALMRAAPNWTSFKRALQRSLPKLNETIPMALDDD